MRRKNTVECCIWCHHPVDAEQFCMNTNCTYFSFIQPITEFLPVPTADEVASIHRRMELEERVYRLTDVLHEMEYKQRLVLKQIVIALLILISSISFMVLQFQHVQAGR